MDNRPNEQVWVAWVKDNADRLLLFARQRTRCEADAQDVVQEAVLEALRRTGGHQPPPLALMIATLRRRAIDLARKEDRRNRRENAFGKAAATEWFDSSIEDREMAQWIESAMNEIPADQRDVITLHVWGGLTFEEIGRALDLPPNTAASRYRYGLEGLRRRTRQVCL